MVGDELHASLDALVEYQRFQSVHMLGARGELRESTGVAYWFYHVDEPGRLGTRQKVAQAVGLAPGTRSAAWARRRRR